MDSSDRSDMSQLTFRDRKPQSVPKTTVDFIPISNSHVVIKYDQIHKAH